jgi:hypothetical protein
MATVSVICSFQLCRGRIAYFRFRWWHSGHGRAGCWLNPVENGALADRSRNFPVMTRGRPAKRLM